MKAKTFENLLRKIVREEIDYSLRRELKTLKEDIRDELKPTITEHKERLINVQDENSSKTIDPMPEQAKNSLREKIMGKAPIKQRPPQNYTSNSTLNDLLNETAQGDTNLESGNAPVSLSQPFASGAPMSMDTTGMPDSVANAVTKDYSGLMKAIEKKKGR
jgi:hypothetical protein